jgi:peptide-methionine (S)-S-oxide reductase
MFGLFKKTEMPTSTLPGRGEPMPVISSHYVTGNPLKEPFPDGLETIYIAMGCFWGAERLFWSIPGVYSTAVGYMAGSTPNPTYREVCTGQTGHTEAVMVVYDPAKVSIERLLKPFWEEHDPTQGMRQGNDVGTQYRSGIYTTTTAQYETAIETCNAIARQLDAKGMGPITTEIMRAPEFYYAEDMHQQYLAKNPGGYCGLSGTGVTCPVPATV